MTLPPWRYSPPVSVPMRPMYERFVSLTNEGAREVGFKDTGDLSVGAWAAKKPDGSRFALHRELAKIGVSPSTLVDVAREHGATTIAERVEDANTMAVLWQLGIEFIQGYFVNSPERVVM